MEESKLQALHDSLSKIRGRKGLGTNGSQFSWQRTTAASSNLPSNALYANFVPEGSYDPQSKGDGRAVKRDFSDCIAESKEERKRRRKEEKKAAKLQAKREAKLEEKRRLKAAAKEGKTTSDATNNVTVSDDSLKHEVESEATKEKKATKSKEIFDQSFSRTEDEDLKTNKKNKKSKKRKRDNEGVTAVKSTIDATGSKPKKQKKKSKKKDET